MSNKTREAFVVYYLYDSETNILGAKDTYEEAFNLMKEDFDAFNESTNSKNNFIESNRAKSDGGDSKKSCSWCIRKESICNLK